MSDKQSIDQDQRELPVKPLCHQTLIAGSFTLNPFPNSLLMLSLTKEAILINGEISTIFPHPNIIPITPELTHRITIQKAVFFYLLRPIHKIYFGFFNCGKTK